MYSGSTFQSVVNGVLGDLPFKFFYMDEFLVALRTKVEHEQHQHLIFNQLQTHQLTINLKKCILGRSTMTFLGDTRDSKRIRPLLDQITTIQNVTISPSP